MVVRPCAAGDVDALERAMPIGSAFGHEYWFGEQQAGRWLYLVAFAPDVVGSCLVHWDGPVNKVVRDCLPDCVEVTHVYVVANARGRGYGRAMLAEAERAVVLRGRRTIGLGVGDDNPRARKLYESLGYTGTGVRYVEEFAYVDGDGRDVQVIEDCEFLFKPLRPRLASPPAADRI